MRIFVSYRRSDAQDFAGRLVDRLRAAPGVHDVFLDVAGIDPGENFEAKLAVALARCDVCLAVIGPSWRGLRADGSARIDEPADFVRQEVRLALAGKARVVPVLANGAEMPGPEALPEDLRGLASLNALSVRHADFDRDVDHLLDALFERRRPTGLAAYLTRHPLQALVLRSLGGLVLALAALVAVAAVHNAVTGRSLDETLGGPGPTIVLIVLALLAGAWVPNWLRRRGRATGG